MNVLRNLKNFDDFAIYKDRFLGKMFENISNVFC